MKVSRVSAVFESPIGNASVHFFTDYNIDFTRASVLAHDMAGRIFDGRKCELVSLSVSHNHEVSNSDCVMHFPIEVTN